MLFLLQSSRPKVMDEVAHQEEVIQVLKKTMESQNVHFLYFLTH